MKTNKRTRRQEGLARQWTEDNESCREAFCDVA
jgi:hypothetical protein